MKSSKYYRMRKNHNKGGMFLIGYAGTFSTYCFLFCVRCIKNKDPLHRATTNTVVHGSLAVLGLDFILTALMFD